ncbi:hypothetical protein Gotur_022928 [Gossypium turneri]
MNECELLRDHISQFITLLNDLKNVEVHIDEEDQAILLLCSLPLHTIETDSIMSLVWIARQMGKLSFW